MVSICQVRVGIFSFFKNGVKIITSHYFYFCVLKENPVFLLFEMSVNPAYSVYVISVQRVLKKTISWQKRLGQDVFFPSFSPHRMCLYQIHVLSSILYKTGICRGRSTWFTVLKVPCIKVVSILKTEIPMGIGEISGCLL